MDIRIQPTGKLIKRHLAANGLTQIDLAKTSNYSTKQVNLVLSGKARLTPKFAEALEKALPGTNKEFWLRYDQRFSEQSALEEQKLSDIGYYACDKSTKISKILDSLDMSPLDAFDVLSDALHISSFDSLPSALVRSPLAHSVCFSRDKHCLEQDTTDPTYLQIWSLLATDTLACETEERHFVGNKKTRELLEEYKYLFNVDNSRMLIANIQSFCEKAGIYVGFTKCAPNTGVKGLTYRIGDKVFILLTDRFKSIEFTAFVFVHELFHIISNDLNNEVNIETIDHEFEIDTRTKDYFVSKSDYDALSQLKPLLPNNILDCACKNQVSPGILITMLQHDGIVDYAAHRQYLNKFVLSDDFIA